MNQIERMTPGATIMMQPFSQRMQQYSAMSDKDLQRLGKEIYDQHKVAASMHANARLDYAGAYKSLNRIMSLNQAQFADRTKLNMTPWYRPFKKAALKSSIAAREGKIASARKHYVASGAAAIVASKRGEAMESPAMKQGTLVLREISQILQVREAERVAAMGADLRARKAIQAQKEAQMLRQKQHRAHVKTMENIHGAFDELDEIIEERNRLYEREIERPRY